MVSSRQQKFLQAHEISCFETKKKLSLEMFFFVVLTPRWNKASFIFAMRALRGVKGADEKRR